MRTQLIGVALAAALVRPAAAAAADDWLAGEWIGGFETADGTVYLSAEFSEADGQLTGTIDVPQRGELDVPLERVKPGERSLTFEVRGSRANLLFEARRQEDGRLTGSVRQGFSSTGFELRKVATLAPARLDAIAGNYELEPGHIVLIARSTGGLIYLDQEVGRLGALYPLDDRTLIAGPSVLAGFPVELTVTLEESDREDGRVERLVWARKGRKAISGVRRTFYRTEQIAFYNGSTRLSGTIVLPNAPGPHPGVVMIHGSGPATRDSLRPWADVYARAGIAVLIHDKRGTGASMGSWSTATFDDLAGDALAGLAYMQSRPEVNPAQIGLHGMSLGGWVAPLAALRSRDVAFVIAESAPALTPLEHERLRVEHQLRADGFSREIISRALSFMDDKFEVARTGRGWEKLQRSMAHAVREGWISYVNPPPSLENLRWNWEHVLSYDPLPALEKLTCPILVLYGALDSIVPASVHRDRMEAALSRAKTRDVTIKVFDRANHAFLEAVTGGRLESASLKGFVRGYLGTHVAWLSERVGVPAGGPTSSQGPSY